MFLVVFVSLLIYHSIALNSTDHVCYREETYTELVQIPIKQPVKVRSHNWCLEFPPRCSNYKTEIREVIKLQNLTKTRTVEYCCDGYAEIISGNETICKPICRGGCGRGYCYEPNQCNCDIGYIGRHCTQRCQYGRWGEDCKNICKCRNGSLCDNRIGVCRCTEGWIGPTCDQPCPNGFYGIMCKTQCECSSNKCDAITGECKIEDSATTTEIPYISRPYSNERIDVNQWIKVDSNNLPADVQPLLNTTSVIIETLNSSIANLTENIDKLTKNLDRTKIPVPDPVTLLIPKPIMDITTIKTLQEVIVIKHNDPIVVTNNQQPIHSDNDSPMMSESGEMIQVIGNWQQSYQKSSNNNTHVYTKSPNQDYINAILLFIGIFSIGILASSVGFVIIYRKYLKRNQRRNRNAQTVEITTDGIKVLSPKPLPDLPAFTQNLTKKSVPEFYDFPSNNSIVKSPSPSPYCYTISSDYCIAPKPFPRKDSIDHLYDEIKYPAVRNSQV